jgi:hypothetical protein
MDKKIFKNFNEKFIKLKIIKILIKNNFYFLCLFLQKI